MPVSTGLLTLAIATVSCSLLLPSARGANLLINGSFELGTYSFGGDGAQDLAPGSTVITGWTVVTNHVAPINTPNVYSIAAQDGLVILDIQGYTDSLPYGAVTQTVPTIIGATYSLSFWIGVQNSIGYAAGPAGVTATAGSISQTFTNTLNGTGNQWQQFSMTFTAASASTPITLAGYSTAGGAYIGLDNASLILASTTAIWLGGTGTWSTPAKWTTDPNVPNNGTPAGALYDVLIPTGTVNLDTNPAIQSIAFGTASAFIGTLNLATSKLIVQSTSNANKTAKLLSLAAAINSGSNGGTWTGTGITSDAAANDPQHYAVGLFDNAVLNLPAFGGTPADPSSILLTLAHLGDANDSGIVDIQDQSIVTNHWQSAQTNWATGDLNLDGFVDLQDLTLVTNNWQQSSTFALNSILTPGGGQSASPASVPEPLTLLTLALTPLFLPRRNKHAPRQRERP